MKKWIEPRLRKPPQGKKVLCFNNGDIDVRHRFKDYWIPIPYTDSKHADLEEPKMWQEIECPPGFTGFMRVIDGEDGKLYNMDEWEKVNPKEFNELVEKMVEHFEQTRKQG